MKPKLKICGMKHNTAEVAALQPDYLGFIFYQKSPRFFQGELPPIASEIKRVGVFVDASLKEISEKTKRYQLDVIQLHGEETAQFCEQISALPAEIWKVFSIKDQFDFTRLKPYETIVDKFLFDTKGKEKGGNGYTFDWTVLKAYPSNIPIVLSGGIGLEEKEAVREILKTKLPIAVLDINSKFERKPGLKEIPKLETFMTILKTLD